MVYLSVDVGLSFCSHSVPRICTGQVLTESKSRIHCAVRECSLLRWRDSNEPETTAASFQIQTQGAHLA